MNQKNLNDDDIYIIISCYTMNSNYFSGLWTREDVQYASAYKNKKYKNILFEDIVSLIGEEKCKNVIEDIIKYRKYELNTIKEMIEKNNEVTCKICGIPESSFKLGFYAIRSIETKRDWTKTLLSIGISAITLPLFGYGGLLTPNKIEKMKSIKLDYRICEKCAMKYRTIFGNIKLPKVLLEKHPSVIIGQRIGFDTVKYVEEISGTGI